MISAEITSKELFNSFIWSVQYFLSQQNDNIVCAYPTKILGDLVSERREQSTRNLHRINNIVI